MLAEPGRPAAYVSLHADSGISGMHESGLEVWSLLTCAAAERRYMSLRLPLTTLAVGGLGLTIAGDLFSEQQQQQRRQHVSAGSAAAVKSDV
jgi:N-acetylmuramoyl-L-alanine amidase